MVRTRGPFLILLLLIVGLSFCLVALQLTLSLKTRKGTKSSEIRVQTGTGTRASIPEPANDMAAERGNSRTDGVCVLICPRTTYTQHRNIEQGPLIGTTIPSIANTTSSEELSHVYVRLLIGFSQHDLYYNGQTLELQEFVGRSLNPLGIDFEIIPYKPKRQTRVDCLNHVSTLAHQSGCKYSWTLTEGMKILRPGWVTAFSETLHAQNPPDVGAIIPFFVDKGRQSPMNWGSDFVHASHITLFGGRYPAELPDGQMTRWMGLVYSDRIWVLPSVQVTPAPPASLEPDVQINPTLVAKSMLLVQSLLMRNQNVSSRPKFCVLICATVKHTRGTHVWRDLSETPLMQYAIPSIARSTSIEDSKKIEHKVFVAVDSDDDFYRKKLSELNSVMAELLAPKWMTHSLILLDPPSQNVVQCYNNVTRLAHADGCDYSWRITDDMQVLTRRWAASLVDAMLSFQPPNVGVVAPRCIRGQKHIMVSDVIHSSHLQIFGSRYPEQFENWYSDNWMTQVYGAGNTRATVTSVTIKHHAHQHRYKVHNASAVLPILVSDGYRRFQSFVARANHSLTASQSPQIAQIGRLCARLLQAGSALSDGGSLTRDTVFAMVQSSYPGPPSAQTQSRQVFLVDEDSGQSFHDVLSANGVCVLEQLQLVENSSIVDDGGWIRDGATWLGSGKWLGAEVLERMAAGTEHKTPQSNAQFVRSYRAGDKQQAVLQFSEYRDTLGELDAIPAVAAIPHAMIHPDGSIQTWDGALLVLKSCQSLAGKGPKREDNTQCGLGHRHMNTTEVAVVISTFWGGYFHFMLEGMVRLPLVEAAVLEDPRTKIHVRYTSSYVEQLLSFFNVAAPRIISGFQCASIALVPEPAACGNPSFHHLNLLRRRLSSLLRLPVTETPPDSSDGHRIVVIKRSRKRVVGNHQELVAGLRREHTDENVVEHSGNESLARQLELFNWADTVIGPHGAGLANIVVSRPRTIVVEFLMHEVNICYFRVALKLYLRYIGMHFPPKQLTAGPRPAGPELIQVDVGRVIAAVGNAMLQPRPEVADQEDGDG